MELEAINTAYDYVLQQRKKLLSQRSFVDVNIVYKGIEYYRFLSEFLPPATMPDVPFMAALLELQSPVISKAAFLLETAYFVNRCNRKDWPEWIKMNIGSYRPHGSLGSCPKNMFNPLRRNKIYQLAASNMFLAWAEVLANKLETIIDSREPPATTKIDPATGCELDLTAEDYYDEELINPNGNNCPFALQNVVCILLLEITTFLRETYQYMPKKVSLTNTDANLLGQVSRSGKDPASRNDNSYFHLESSHVMSSDMSDNEIHARDQYRTSRIDSVCFTCLKIQSLLRTSLGSSFNLWSTWSKFFKVKIFEFLKSFKFWFVLKLTKL